MGRLAIVVIAGFALAACASNLANLPPSPERPGTRVTIKSPNPEKWVVAQTAAQAKTAGFLVWACKPLACSAERSMVAGWLGKSPTRSPDKEALARATKLLSVQTKAQDMVMDAASEGDERITPLANAVTEVRGYPAIGAESKKIYGGKTDYIYRSDIFVGFTMVRIVSTSSMRAQSKRHFDEFAEAMEIIDVAPPAPGTQATPSPAALSGGDHGTNAPQ